MTPEIAHKHMWWHADDVHHHLVCLTCGEAMHYIDVRKVSHTISRPSVHGGNKGVGCGDWYHKGHYTTECNSGNDHLHQ